MPGREQACRQGARQGGQPRRGGRRALSRLVCARMSRSTDRHASVPLLTKRTISTLGTRSMTILASTFSSAHGAPNEVPCARRGALAAAAPGRALRRRAGAAAEQPAVLRRRRRQATGRPSHRPGGALGEPGHRAKKAARARARGSGGRAGARLVDLLLQRLGHLRVRVADDGRAPAAHVVDVLARAAPPVSQAGAPALPVQGRAGLRQRCLQATAPQPRPGAALAGKPPRAGPPAGAPHLVAVHVEAVGPADVVEDDGLPADRLERAHRRVDAARQQRQRLLEHLRARAPGAAATHGAWLLAP